MKAAVYDGAGRFRVEETPDPTPTGNQVLIRVDYCGVCGSDLHAVRAGTLPAGAILGHEISGRVAAVGPLVRGLHAGDAVTTLSAVPCDACDECAQGRFRTCRAGWQIFGYSTVPGGYAEYALSHASVIEKMPPGIDPLDAALNEPAIVGLHAVRISRLRFGAGAAVIGAGPVGLLVVQAVLLTNSGPVFVIEPSPGRRKMASDLGATAVFAPGDPALGQRLDSEFEAGGPDVVFECAGARGTLQSAIEMVRPGGQVVVPGVNMEDDEVSPLTMIGKECEIVGALGGGDLFRTALEHLAAGRIRGRAMVTRVIGLDEVDAAFQELGTAGCDDVKVLVAPGGAR